MTIDTRKLIAFCLTMLLIRFPLAYGGNITSDGSVGTVVDHTASLFTIRNGTQRGANLFHSFGDFQLDTDEMATFTGPASIDNIIARVTGGRVSHINGMLDATSIAEADLFFLNPAGVLVGPDAVISVGGALHLSTADYLRLSDGSRFNASDPSGSTLTSAGPDAFGFLSDHPEGLKIEGYIGSGPGQPLSLVAGDIQIKNATIWGGEQVNILSVSSSGDAILTEDGPDVSSFSEFGNIFISGQETLVLLDESEDIKADGMYIRGNDMKISDDAWILSATQDNMGGVIDIHLNGNLTLETGGKILTTTYDEKKGNAGDISVIAKTVDISDDKSEIASTPATASSGQSGDVLIHTDQLSVTANGGIKTDIDNSGDAGSITIKANKSVVVSDGGAISASVLNEEDGGDAGNVEIVTLNGATSEIEMGAPDENTDNTNDTVTDTDDFESKGILTVSEGGVIQSVNYGDGTCGNIDIKADRVDVSDEGAILTDIHGSGAGGSITIAARESVTVADNGVISTSTMAEEGGDAGDIRITVHQNAVTDDCLETEETGVQSPDNSPTKINDDDNKGVLTVSGGGLIQSISEGDGAGGDIEIKADRVEVSNDAGILTDVYGSGMGGSITIAARESVTVADNGVISASTMAEEGGDAGDIQITVHQNAVTDDCLETEETGVQSPDNSPAKINDDDNKGVLTVSGGGLIQSISEGDGAGGEIDLKANRVDLFDEGAVLTDIYGSGAGGQISITATEAVNVYASGRISATSKSEADGGDAGGIRIHIAQNALEDKENSVENEMETDSTAPIDNTEFGLLKVSDNGVITSGSLGDGRGGDIEIDVNRLEIDRGYISSSVRGAGQGGDIHINARDEVFISGSGENDDGLFGEYHGIYAQTLGSGDGGHVFIDTPAMTITKDGMINGQAYNQGCGGNVTINVETLDLTQGGGVTVSTRGAGDAGDIEINASEAVNVSGHGAKLENSWIYSATHSAGNGGDITIRTPDLTVDQNGAIFANTLGDDTWDGNTAGDGDAGNIRLETERIVLDNGGAVLAGSESAGKGGDIDITSDYSVHISNKTPDGGANAAGVESSGIYARAQSSGDGGHISVQTHSLGMTEHGAVSTSATDSGQAGDIDLNLQRLVMHSGSEVTSQSSGSGDAGEIDIHAAQEVQMKRAVISTEAERANGGSVSIDTPFLDVSEKSRISAAVLGGAGQGGQIDINVNTLDVNQSSRLETSTGGRGDGGVITINASETINLNGLPSENTSGLFSVSTGAGDAGRINATAPLITMSGNTTISTSGSASGKGGDVELNTSQLMMDNGASIAAKSTGAGDAGSITIDAGDRIQMENSAITTEALHADGGNISIFAGYMLYMIDSAITAAVAGGKGDGGNITIKKPKFVILNASDIIANAHGGKGGNIDIQADYFLGSAESVLDASSALGVDGVVNVDALDADVSGSVTMLPETFGDEDTVIDRRCDIYQTSEASSLMISGRGGLPKEPDNYLPNILR